MLNKTIIHMDSGGQITWSNIIELLISNYCRERQCNYKLLLITWSNYKSCNFKLQITAINVIKLQNCKLQKA